SFMTFARRCFSPAVVGAPLNSSCRRIVASTKSSYLASRMVCQPASGMGLRLWTKPHGQVSLGKGSSSSKGRHTAATSGRIPTVLIPACNAGRALGMLFAAGDPAPQRAADGTGEHGDAEADALLLTLPCPGTAGSRRTEP